MPELVNRRTAVARASRQVRRLPHDAEAQDQLTRTRAELAEAKLADYIRRTVDAAPPLSADQRARLALLLAPDADNSAAMHNSREAA